jgi:DNA invertase Pin-like site-specific DNA recombinase
MSRTTRAALYSRVSTDEQAERGTSLADQQRRTGAYCETNGWEVAEQFVDDGVSGATIHRPALQQLLRSANAGAFDVVVVTDPDRLSRDLVDGLVIERELARADVGIVYLVQPTMSTLERQLRGVIAEEERRKIRDRMVRGIRAVAEAGFWPGGPPPFGYTVVRNDGEAHSRLVMSPQEAEVITSMIDQFVDGRRSTLEIANDLNDREIPTPGTNRRLSNPGTGRWTHQRVRDVLKTATGISGTWTYTADAETISLSIPAIVTELRHQQLRQRLAETSTGVGATQARYSYLLAGRLAAPCGSNMHGTGRPDRDVRVYKCANNVAERGPARCDCPRIHAANVEARVWSATHEMLTDPERLLALAGIAQDANRPSGVDDLSALTRKIRRIETALGSTIAQLVSNGTDPTAIQHATRQLEDELERLKAHRDRVVDWAATRNTQTDHARRLLTLADTARNTLDNANDELRRDIIQLLDIRVRVTGTRPCPECSGKGLLKASDETAKAGLGRTGRVCPTCARFKRVPSIEISGAIPDAARLQEADAATSAMPFRLIHGT